MRGPWQLGEHDSRTGDDELERLIAHSIGSHPAFWGAMVLVEVAHGYATLTGIVRTELDRRRADLLARAHGALGVHNRLRLESDIANQSI